MQEPENEIANAFRFFNEVGIINQLSSRLFESRLPDGFVVAHFSVLNHLVRLGDGRTPLSIANALQVPKTSMTHTLSGLNKAGLIRFEPNPKDNRSKCVMLTDQGRAFRENAIAAMVPAMTEMAKQIDIERVMDTLPLLEEVRAYLDQERDR